jgi:hypothetical protein
MMNSKLFDTFLILTIRDTRLDYYELLIETSSLLPNTGHLKPC